MDAWLLFGAFNKGIFVRMVTSGSYRIKVGINRNLSHGLSFVTNKAVKYIQCSLLDIYCTHLASTCYQMSSLASRIKFTFTFTWGNDFNHYATLQFIFALFLTFVFIWTIGSRLAENCLAAGTPDRISLCSHIGKTLLEHLDTVSNPDVWGMLGFI